jgi:hypothetical protein
MLQSLLLNTILAGQRHKAGTGAETSRGIQKMREIKFRAWLSYDEHISDRPGTMAHNVAVQDGYYLMHGDDGSMRSPEPYCQIDKRWKVMQFIGLKDKNGTEIYEGDIIREDDGAIVTVDSDMGFNCGCCYPIYGWGIRDQDDGEVIGNIYENKELLK